MLKAILVSSVSEEYAFIFARPCSSCGSRWKVYRQALLRDAKGHHYDRVDVICHCCNKHEVFLFDIHSFFPKAAS